MTLQVTPTLYLGGSSCLAWVRWDPCLPQQSPACQQRRQQSGLGADLGPTSEMAGAKSMLGNE